MGYGYIYEYTMNTDDVDYIKTKTMMSILAFLHDYYTHISNEGRALHHTNFGKLRNISDLHHLVLFCISII